MSITEATMRVTNKRPKIQYYDITFKTDTLDDTTNTLIQNSCIGVKFDVKTWAITLKILEFENDDFYKIINNICASSNIRIMLTNKAPSYTSGSNGIYSKVYTTKYPYLYFRAGIVQKHYCEVELRNDDQCIHYFDIKFTKFKAKYDDVVETL